MNATPPPPLPVTLLSGFLGAGKTTLLQRILAAAPDRRRIAVLENELGAISVDDELVAAAGPGRLATVLGRTCCEAREEFIELLHETARVAARFDRLVIETTGVAHPGMLAHALLGDPVLRERYALDGIVTVVDAAHFREHAGRDGHATEQVAYADAVVVNKTDLVAPKEVDVLLATLRRINADARYYVCTEADAPLAELLNLGGFDLARVENGVSGCRGQERPSEDGARRHAHPIETVAVELPGELDVDRFQGWIEAFVDAHASDLIRAKGIVALAGVPSRFVFQGIHGHFRCTLGRPWADAPRATRLVFIGQELQSGAIRRGLDECRPRPRA